MNCYIKKNVDKLRENAKVSTPCKRLLEEALTVVAAGSSPNCSTKQRTPSSSPVKFHKNSQIYTRNFSTVPLLT